MEYRRRWPAGRSVLLDGWRSPGRGEHAARLEVLSARRASLVPGVPERDGDVGRRHAVGVVRDQAQQKDAVDSQVVVDELVDRLGVVDAGRPRRVTAHADRVLAPIQVSADEPDPVHGHHGTDRPDQEAGSN